jgi:hypothetical protein
MSDRWAVVGKHDFASPYFEVTVDPELPGTGDWTVPVFSFDRDGAAHRGLTNLIGPRQMIDVRPFEAPEWVGVFPSGDLVGTNAVAITPDPECFTVVAGGRPYIVQAARPEQGAVVVREPVTSVVAASAAGLLLLVSFSEIVALGDSGVRWESPRLCLDELEVVGSAGSELRCRGYFMDGPREFLVDASTGEPQGDAPVWG